MPEPLIQRQDQPARRLLFAASDPYLPEAYGGCGVNTHALCRLLEARGASVAVLAGRRDDGPGARPRWARRAPGGGQAIARDEALGYPVFRARDPEAALAPLCREWVPNVVVIQSCPRLVPLTWQCLWLGIPVVIYLHNTDFEFLGGDCVADPSFRYVTNSAYVRRRLVEFWDLPSDVVHPLILPDDYRVTSSREVVTFVNPSPHKGLDIALELAGRRPDVPFEFVESWPLERTASTRLAERLRQLPNVRLRPAAGDMRTVYARSRLVLMPSLCDEAWGRVVTEAQVSGIPALASDAGGLPEAVGDGGVLIPRDAPPEAWAAALSRLWDDPVHYARHAESARNAALRDALQPDRILGRILQSVEAAAAARPSPAIGDGAIQRAGGTIWFDLTTTVRVAGTLPVGMTRVESSYADRFLRKYPRIVRFCEVDRSTGRYRPIAHEETRLHVASRRDLPPPPPRPRRRSPLAEWGRGVERAFRLWRRRQVRALKDRLPGRTRGLVQFATGDVLFLGGNTWGWHDLERLRQIKAETGVKLVFLCHDLIPAKFPHYFLPGFAPAFERFIAFALAEAALILCNSKTTLDDLRDHAATHGLPMPDARRLPLGNELPGSGVGPRPGSLQALSPGGFVLSVGTLQVRKNQKLLYQLWRRLAESGRESLPVLVLAGSIGWLVDDLVEQIRTDPLVGHRIMIIETATDTELAWLYRNCLFTLYPSLYEGFGLPIAESLAYGKHCIASSTSAMPEAGAGLACHLDPLDLEAWLHEVRSLLDDPPRLAAIEARIRAEYQPFGWDQSFELLVEAIADVQAAAGGEALA